MIACIKCGQDNDDGVKFCSKCGAMLPQMAPSGQAGGTLDFDEDTEYIKPTEHFPSTEMLNLAWSLHDFLEEGGELEPFLEQYEVIKGRLESYNNNLHQETLEHINNDRNSDPDDPYPKQVQYLVVRGSSLASEGIALVEHFLDQLDEDNLISEDAKSGVAKIVQANDHFLMALHLSLGRTERLMTVAKERGLNLQTGQVSEPAEEAEAALAEE